MKISDMTLLEKILQTVVIKVDKDNFVSDKIGAAFFFGEIITEADEMGLDAARKTLAEYIDNADIPILITSDFENGCGSMLKGLTPLPYLMSLGAADSEKLAYNYGKATALEARSVGANWSFSPVCDLNINKRNPLVNVRGLTDDVNLAIKLLPQVIKGMQDNGLAACAKHFPGDGLDYRDQHIVTTNNTLSFDEWKKKSGKVFEEVIKSGVYSVMSGHITLPSYQKEIFDNGMKLPATLSHELIENLLKKEMGFDGVVVTDALGMGGFNGWYKTMDISQIESFKAGCDMMLWPSENYVKNMTEAIENGYIPMSRLDDAVTRILSMKEKMGLFKKDNHAITLSEKDREFVKNTQKNVAEKSVTLMRDDADIFPLTTEKYKKIAVIPITHHIPAFDEGKLLADLLGEKGFDVQYLKDGIKKTETDGYDLILYALFSRPFRPIGFLDFHSTEAQKVAISLQTAVDKTAVVSFGSPYFMNQYFERAKTFVNAYSMLSPSVKAFVSAATGETEFSSFSPVEV
ncbi:glycoside hydrolase family 3 protein [Qingrenia yutianensis]|uniref:beta-N-acetylhexosaminidase n=1 Tax=Qingrenia yutianensis TaxID=2763676 RepID=A0A926F612_9FIRM|nr:glycoside hydrolase family 3 N-terminal domain-containing protein [Qingrenia yutianensis]MBC8596418.1 glycoside hydrolase family 3 protein [Qingrenia yutianensis]